MNDESHSFSGVNRAFSFLQEKGNIDLAIRYYLVAIEVCMQVGTCKRSLSCNCFMNLRVALV